MSRKADAKRDELLGLVRAGNKIATERFIRLNAPWMLAVARRYLKDEGLAEDCVQESLLSALRNLEKFEQRCEVKTWLHRIVVNFCLMKLRSTLRAQEQPIDHLLPKFDAKYSQHQILQHRGRDRIEIIVSSSPENDCLSVTKGPLFGLERAPTRVSTSEP